MIQSLLLQWFRKNKRSLPWRRVRDPYAIWISEIMLQQTQVKTVLPYYQRWMRRFPNVRGLVKAPLSEVLKHWEGLGYYRRARNLHQTAQIVWEKRGGKFPDSSDELQKLPGIGRYTAGAIASIAFNKPEPILDGNVKRVLARVLALREPMDKTSGDKKLWETSRRLVRGTSEPGDLNQALMELGALVCLPENPKCFICPLKKVCKAHRIHKENEFPVKAERQKTERLKTVAAVLWKKGKVLLQRQPLHARWGGLWLFPQWTLRNGKGEEEFVRKRAREELGVRIQKLKPRMEIKHGFTKYRVRLRVYEGEAFSGRKNLQWIAPQKIARLPLPRPHQKIFHGITSHA